MNKIPLKESFCLDLYTFLAYNLPKKYKGGNYIMRRTTFGLNDNVAIGLIYLFSWISGLIFLLNEPQDREIRFHAMQSICYGVVVWAVSVLVWFIGGVPLVGWVLRLLSSGLGLASIIISIMAFTGKYVRIPFIAEFAETKI